MPRARGITINEIPQNEGFKILESFGREKKKDFDPRDIGPEKIDLKEFERRKIKCYVLKYGGFKSLVRAGFKL